MTKKLYYTYPHMADQPEKKIDVSKMEQFDPPHCPIHGGSMPVINTTPNNGVDLHGIAGKWCGVCIIKALEKLGVQKCIV